MRVRKQRTNTIMKRIQQKWTDLTIKCCYYTYRYMTYIFYHLKYIHIYLLFVNIFPNINLFFLVVVVVFLLCQAPTADSRNVYTHSKIYTNIHTSNNLHKYTYKVYQHSCIINNHNIHIYTHKYTHTQTYRQFTNMNTIYTIIQPMYDIAHSC